MFKDWDLCQLCVSTQDRQASQHRIGTAERCAGFCARSSTGILSDGPPPTWPYQRQIADVRESGLILELTRYAAYFHPSPLYQTAQDGTNSIPLRQRHVIEIQSACGRHSVLRRHASVVSPRMVRVAGTTMISFRRSITSSRVRTKTGQRLSGRRNVPADLSALHPNSSQPSASQASGASSAGNSSREGGTVR